MCGPACGPLSSVRAWATLYRHSMSLKVLDSPSTMSTITDGYSGAVLIEAAHLFAS